jgi:hypothetical protein
MVCAIEMLPTDSLQFPYFQICMTLFLFCNAALYNSLILSQFW